MQTFDPRTISTPVCTALQELRSQTEKARMESDPNLDKKKKQATLKDQKNQAVELYTYLATWGMLRLKAEEQAISPSQEGKKQVVRQYFTCLESLSEIANLSGNKGLNTLKNLSTDSYLGLTGLGLEIAKEFSFWANAIYHDVKGEN